MFIVRIPIVELYITDDIIIYHLLFFFVDGWCDGCMINIVHYSYLVSTVEERERGEGS